jgi:hypothetical protein
MALKKSLLMILLISFSALASAEYYRYTDEKGNVHFTDDPAMIPESQRKIAHEYMTANNDPETGKIESLDEAQTPAFSEDDLEDREYDFEAVRKSLDKTKSDLDAEYKSLMKEKEQLEKHKKTIGTDAEAKKYNDNVSKLNEKIKSYDEIRKKFKAEVKAYNAKVEAKENEGEKNPEASLN